VTRETGQMAMHVAQRIQTSALLLGHDSFSIGSLFINQRYKWQSAWSIAHSV
jgi:hypothetical protein